MRAFSYAARAQSRAIIVDSETDGTPAMPRRAAASPSCMTPCARELGVLLVERDLKAGERLVLERAAHDAGALDGQAVVGEADRSGVAQLGHVGELLAAHAARDRGDEADWDGCVRLRALAEGLDRGRSVHRRLGVGHADDPAVAAGGGRAAARLDVLLVLAPGRAEVDVRVEERGHGEKPVGVDHLGAFAASAMPAAGQLGDAAVADDDVVRGVDVGAGVEDARVRGG